MQTELQQLFSLGNAQQDEVLEAVVGTVVGTNPDAAGFAPKWRRGSDVGLMDWAEDPNSDPRVMPMREAIVREAKAFVNGDAWEPFVEETMGTMRGRAAITSLYFAGLLALSHEVAERRGSADDLAEEIGRLVSESVADPRDSLQAILAVSTLAATMFAAAEGAGGINIGDAVETAYNDWKTTRLGQRCGALMEGVLIRLYGSLNTAFSEYTQGEQAEQPYAFGVSTLAARSIDAAKALMRSHLAGLLNVYKYRGGKFYTLGDGEQSQAETIFPGVVPATTVQSEEEFAADEQRPQQGGGGASPRAGGQQSSAGADRSSRGATSSQSTVRQPAVDASGSGSDWEEGSSSDARLGSDGGSDSPRAGGAAAASVEVGVVGAYLGMTEAAWKSCLALMVRTGIVQSNPAIDAYIGGLREVR